MHPQDQRNNTNFLLLLLGMTPRIVLFGFSKKTWWRPAQPDGTEAERIPASSSALDCSS